MTRIFLLVPMLLILIAPLAVGATLSQELPPVVVTSTMTEQNLEVAPGTVQVITQKEIDSLAAETVADVLRHAPGMVLISGTGRSQEVSIRGLGPGHTLVLLDGRRITGGYNAVLDVNQIPVTLIDHIEIVRGPGSALYGSEATGGVINIITRRPPRKTEGAVDIRGAVGDSAEQSVQAMVGAGAGPFRASIAAARFCKDGWDGDDELPDDIDDTVLDTVYARGALDLGSTQTLLMGGEWNVFSREGRRYYQNLARTRDSEDRRWGGFLQYETNPENAFNGMVRVYGNKSEGDYDFSPSADEASKERELFQAETRGSFTPTNGMTFTAGGEVRWQTLKGEELIDETEDGESDRVKAIFGQVDWQPYERLNIVASTRYDDYDNSGSHVTPRLIASLFIPYGRFWVSYGHGFRAPTLDELYGKIARRQGREIYYGNADLDPETSQGYETGLELRSEAMWGRLVYFHNRLDDLIEARLAGTQGRVSTYEYRNVEEAWTYGTEMEAGIAFTRDIALTAQATWLLTENEETGLELAYEPNWKGELSLSWKVPSIGLETQVHYLYFGSCEDGAGNDVDGYRLVNLYVTKVLTDMLRLYAGADNLFDEANDYFTQSPVQVYAGMSISY